MNIARRAFTCLSLSLAPLATFAFAQAPGTPRRHNVIIFVADGLRRGSVTKEDMPTFFKVREQGVDFRNSHAVFPTFTTANASVIATGHGLGDTGDYSNTIYPGRWLTKPWEVVQNNEKPAGSVVPFLESDDVLASMNAAFGGNYLGERTLMSVAREHKYQVASIGKVGPTAIQQIESVTWDKDGFIPGNGAIVIDDQTGLKFGIGLPSSIVVGLRNADLLAAAPARSNGYDAKNQNKDNGYAGDVIRNAGTLAPNLVQQQWFTDVTTRVLLPHFTEGENPDPFLLLFWSRDPDGTQHNQGDSLQSLQPGINGETSRLALRNADRCLKQLLDWLDAHPAVKAETDVLLTSDHGFATISRRETGNDAEALTHSIASQNIYEPAPGETFEEPAGTLPTGFLAIDLGLLKQLRTFDAGARATTSESLYEELAIRFPITNARGEDRRTRPGNGSALLGGSMKQLDGSDAQLIVAANGGSDLIYVPSGDINVVHETLKLLTRFDYIGGIFVDDKYCPEPTACPGALPLSAIGMKGKSDVPRPAIVVSFKSFERVPGDLQSTIQIADTTLQEGQGQHGGFSRAQTLNNMAAMGPDFGHGVDDEPVGNIDIAPTLANILGIAMPSKGDLKGRVLEEALRTGKLTATKPVELSTLSAATDDGTRTLLLYQERNGVRYPDRACLITAESKVCP